MAKKRGNQHRWKMWLEPRVVEVLEEARETLKESWERDKRYPKSYPTNTSHALYDIKAELTRSSRASKKMTGLPVPPPPPKSVHDFIDERTIKTLYEDRHAGSYKQAIKQASEGDGRGYEAWKRIVNCLRAAYVLSFGEDYLPKPTVHLLHRELLEIAQLLELDLRPKNTTVKSSRHGGISLSVACPNRTVCGFGKRTANSCSPKTLLVLFCHRSSARNSNA
jgi:hypothetical protein